MKRKISLYLEDILESIVKIEGYTKSTTLTKFQDDQKLQDAVIRRLEIIGEAVKNIPDEIRDKYSDIPWKNIAGMRDVLIHEYFGVNIERTWRTIKEDLPPLKNKLIVIMRELKN